jgi:dTDP-4-dehydrorhamnose reductase
LKRIETIEDLEERLSRPTKGVLETLRSVPGEILVLGAGGKMGPTLTRMASRALESIGQGSRVLAVSRFSNPTAADQLLQHGVQPISCDLTKRDQVNRLPDAPNVIFMAGQKFGTSDQPELTWITNTLVPAIVAERYSTSRIVVFSTGCVYPLAPVDGPGSREDDVLGPPGEYANSCVGRERIFAHFSTQNGTPMLMFRLNYAVELRYGVLLDVALKVARGIPVDVTVGWANVIWQGDANARAIQCLAHVAAPPRVLNATGGEKISVRTLAARFGELFRREPIVIGTEAPTAWLSDPSRSLELFGPLTMTLDEMIDAVADWVKHGGVTLGKPTHFEVRDGQF